MTPVLQQLLDRVSRRTIRDRITRKLPPKRWVWDGYIGAGELAYLHGMGGLAKSLVAQALAPQRIRPQVGFLLDRPVTPGVTLYLDAENDDAVIDDRLRRLGVGADADNIVYWTIEPGSLGQAQDAGLLDQLLEHLIREAGADLAVFDSWSTLWGKDEIDHVAAQEFFNSLNRVRRTTACALLLIGHDNRRGDFRGLAVIHNSVQSRMHLKPTRDRDADATDEDDVPIPVSDLTLWHEKQRSAALLPKLPLTVTWTSNRVMVRAAGRHAGAIEKVVNHVYARRPEIVPTKELAELAGVERSYINKRIDLLHRSGLERDREDSPTQSTGWRVASAESNPAPAQGSTMRAADPVLVTPETPAQGSTMRAADPVLDAPPTGEGVTPVGTTAGGRQQQPTAHPRSDGRVRCPQRAGRQG